MEIHAPDVRTTVGPVAELDRLGDEIAELSAHLEVASARLLDLIREFDARGGWNTGFRSCADWLSWRIGLDLGTAREKVRVARSLGTLPLLAQALARGELSYAKVRALTRVATAETEARLLGVGRGGTAAHVERNVRGWRCVDRKAEARESARQHASRALHVHQDEDGTVVVRDLDFFVNDDDRFGLWAQRVVQALVSEGDWRVLVVHQEARFVRLTVTDADIVLKIEMVNDVPAHVGELKRDPVLGLLDSAENILANRLTAVVDRKEPRDFADIWGFCCRLGLSCEAALDGAQSKAAGLFPADVARVLLSLTEDDWRLVRWRDAPESYRFIGDLKALGERLLLLH